MAGDFYIRTSVEKSDAAAVREIVSSTGFFHPPEIEVAVELVEENLQKGVASGYLFIFACSSQTGEVLGYSCYGEIPCTTGSYDLYWIAVHQKARGGGLGGKLMHETEEAVRKLGGRGIYAETSGREQYTPTRKFYEKFGYRLCATFPDFYAPGDDKVVYVKNV